MSVLCGELSSTASKTRPRDMQKLTDKRSASKRGRPIKCDKNWRNHRGRCSSPDRHTPISKTQRLQRLLRKALPRGTKTRVLDIRAYSINTQDAIQALQLVWINAKRNQGDEIAAADSSSLRN